MKPSPANRCRLLIVALVGLGSVPWTTPAPVHAHAGHDHGPGEERAAGTGGGPVTISAQARANLVLQTVEAEVRTLDRTFLALGQIDAIPNRQAAVSSRIAGRVVALPFEPGQSVKRGQVVVEVESFQVGNPPPRVRYEAPTDGIILARDVFLGSSVNPDSRILTVADPREVYAEARVFEGQVGLVRAGQKVRVRLPAFPGETLEGTVERLDAALDAATRTLKVWARVPNPDGRLRPNLQAEVTFVTAEAEGVTAVPRAAVLEGEGGSRFVFIEQEAAAPAATNPRETPAAPAGGSSTFERREVVTGVADDRFVEITEGVLPGDKVVVQGNYQLQYVRGNQPSAAPAADAKEGHGKRGAGHEHPVGHAHGGVRSPLVLGLGAALLLSLVVNAALVRRRRRPVVAPPVRPATPSPAREPEPAHRA